MRLEIQFNHMDRSEAVEEFAREKVEAALDGVLHRNDCHVLVWLINGHSRVQKGTPEMVCEIEVRYPPRKDLFISKRNPDMYTAIVEATDSLRTLVREDGKREIQQSRQARS